MTNFAEFDRRPIILAIAGPNGAGKTTFFHSHLASTGLRFINADALAHEFAIEAYEAARLANQLRVALVAENESFIFETVFSDPVGDKIEFLEAAALQGYEVVLCYIGLPDPNQSTQRVAMRVSQGGHDVPFDKLLARFPRSLANLQAAIAKLPHVLVFDNSDLNHPYRLAAAFDYGKLNRLAEPVPEWLKTMIP